MTEKNLDDQVISALWLIFPPPNMLSTPLIYFSPFFYELYSMSEQKQEFALIMGIPTSE